VGARVDAGTFERQRIVTPDLLEMNQRTLTLAEQ
jgi:hypothetical protein